MMEDDVQDRAKISEGASDRPVNETIAGTGPGIPDEALFPGEELPNPPSDAEVERAATALGAVPEEANAGGKQWWRKPGVAAAAGIGSAAIVAALLYAGSRNRRS
jgi:hypothetical protein